MDVDEMSGLGNEGRSFGNAIGARRVIRSRHDDLSAEGLSYRENFFVVRGNENAIEFLTFTGSLVNVLNQRLSKQGKEGFPREARGGPASWDDSGNMGIVGQRIQGVNAGFERLS